MGTHPIFESDFDCLTDCNSAHFSLWLRKRDVERRPLLPFRRTRPTSSVIRSNSDDDVRAKLTTSPVSDCVSRQEQVQHPKIPSSSPYHQQGHHCPSCVRSSS